jgi:hypothetical protein
MICSIVSQSSAVEISSVAPSSPQSGAEPRRAVARLGDPGMASSGKSPHFWTEKYPGRTFRSRSRRISRKSTRRPQARSRTPSLSTLRGGSGGPRQAGTPSRLIGLVPVHASRLVRVGRQTLDGIRPGGFVTRWYKNLGGTVVASFHMDRPPAPRPYQRRRISSCLNAGTFIALRLVA